VQPKGADVANKDTHALTSRWPKHIIQMGAVQELEGARQPR
jgi:hypothetical protein